MEKASQLEGSMFFGGKRAIFPVGSNGASRPKVIKLTGGKGGSFLVGKKEASDGREQAFRRGVMEFSGGKGASFPVGTGKG